MPLPDENHMTSSASVASTSPAASGVAAAPPLSLRRILRTWVPLALGWLIMTFEQPLLAAAVARTADPRVQLAAWGITFPIALILAAPSMVMLATSTTLSKDWASYRTVRRYMLLITAVMTGIHVLLAFTPLFDLVIVGIISPPADVVEPVRTGLRLMLPWCFSLALRRFNYGVLIRFDHSRAVTIGALVRLGADVVAMVLLFLIGAPGIIIATGTILTGVVAEMIFALWRVRPVLRDELRPAPRVNERITFPTFLLFYVPLVLTSLLQIIIQPMTGAALSRMPTPLDSLAVWPVVFGALLVLLSVGLSLIEAVVVLLDEPNALRSLRRFTLWLAGIVLAVLLFVNLTPLAELWFVHVAALPPELVGTARIGLWIALLVPSIAVFEGFFQGLLLYGRRTRAITEAVSISILVNAAILVVGVVLGNISGIYVGVTALAVGAAARFSWMWWRTRAVVAEIEVG